MVAVAVLVAVVVAVLVAVALAVAVLVAVLVDVLVLVEVAVLVLVAVLVAVAVGTDERQRTVRSVPDAALSDTANWVSQWIVHCAPGRIVIDRVAATTIGTMISMAARTPKAIKMIRGFRCNGASFR